MGVFPQDSINRREHLIDTLYIIEDHGPAPEDIADAYNSFSSPHSFDDVSLSRLQAMGVITSEKGSDQRDTLSTTIKLTKRGEAILDGDVEPLTRGLSDAFVGFYDTLAVLAASPVRISTIRSYLNQANDVDWSSNQEPKRRLDWLRDWDLAELQRGPNDYTLTDTGKEIFNSLSAARGPSNVVSLFGGDANSGSEDGVSGDPSQNSSETITDRNETTPEGAVNTLELPLVDRDQRKVFSIHVNKSDTTIERYRQTVEESTPRDSADWISAESFPGDNIRYWGVKGDKLEKFDGLVRGDALLFHHYDDGYMAVGVVLTVDPIDVPQIPVDYLILFESVHDVEMNRGDVFEIFDWEAHPNGWARIDYREEFSQRYDSAEEFIENAQGTIEFDYWAPDNWPVSSNLARKLNRQLRRKGQTIIYGPPGTGKTFSAETFAKWWTGKQENTVPTEFQTKSVTFHPAYSYEDFVEGYTITDDQTSETTVQEQQSTSSDSRNNSPYGLKRGVFRKFCEYAEAVKEATADDQPTPRYVFIIDELNRGNVPQIFGENITVLEKDKRGSPRDLSHSGDSFTIPKNVFVIATMNTADQSITRLDAAIRRRFAALQLPPSYDVFYELDDDSYPESREAAVELIQTDRAGTEPLLAVSLLALEIINERIVQVPSLGKGKRIGHTYLLPEVWQEIDMDVSDETALTDVWRYDILPLLEEYFFQDVTAIEQQIFAGEATFVDPETNDIVDLTPGDLREKLRTFVLDNQETLDLSFEVE